MTTQLIGLNTHVYHNLSYHGLLSDLSANTAALEGCSTPDAVSMRLALLDDLI